MKTNFLFEKNSQRRKLKGDPLVSSGFVLRLKKKIEMGTLCDNLDASVFKKKEKKTKDRNSRALLSKKEPTKKRVLHRKFQKFYNKSKMKAKCNEFHSFSSIRKRILPV